MVDHIQGDIGDIIHSQLSKCCTARVSNAGLYRIGPTKVKASKSFLFTEGSLEVKIKNNCLI